ncbi:MAG: ABC transporter permease [Deltaproteobacteria bacterium]|nr:ABC transporter permease [Deltaproteobacteria bacterium]
MNVLRHAWRNIWRNKRRTGITLAAVTLNTAILIMVYALMDGMIKHTVHSATNVVIGEVQAHGEGYREDLSFYKSLPDPEAFLEKAAANNIGAAPRSYGFGLVSVGSKSAGALFWGIDPALEREVFDLDENLQSGRFLLEKPEQGIVLGKKLARSLHAKVGSEIIVVVQAADGSLGNELYTVTGTLKSVGDYIDRGAAILHQDDFRELFVSGGRIHEIAFNSRGKIPVEEVAAMVTPANQEAEVRTWRELVPMLNDMVRLFDTVIWIFGAIFFLAAGLGVMNTMLMATYERIREFGILKAIGTSPWRIVSNMALEALVLSVTAAAVGLILGLLGTYYLSAVGIDTSLFAGEFSFSGVAFDPIWRAAFSVEAAVVPMVVMCVICTIASLYPAVIAARLDPVRAIHHV